MPDAPKRFGRPEPPKRFEHRDLSHRRLYDWRWQKYSRRFRKDHPLCERCKSKGRIVASEVVDHVIPHRGDQRLFWAEENHSALCSPCHDFLTWAVDGAFGRPLLAKPNYRRGEKDTPEILSILAAIGGG